MGITAFNRYRRMKDSKKIDKKKMAEPTVQNKAQDQDQKTSKRKVGGK